MKSVFKEQSYHHLVVQPLTTPQFDSHTVCALWKWFNDYRFFAEDLSMSLSSFDQVEMRSSNPHSFYPEWIFQQRCQGSESFEESFLKTKNIPWFLFRNPKDKQQLTFLIQYKNPSIEKGIALQKNLESFLKQNPLPILTHWVGGSDQQIYVSEAIQRAKQLNGLTLFILWVGLWLIFRRKTASVLYLCTLFITSLIVYGMMGFAGHDIDMGSSSIFTLIAMSTLEDFIFVSFHLNKTKNPIHSLRQLLIPSFYTSLTTVIGFGSLYLSSFDLVRNLGLWSAVGVALEWFVLFILLPPLWKKYFKNKSWIADSFEKNRIFNWLNHLSHKKPSFRVGLIASSVFLIVLLVPHTLQTQQRPEETFSINHPLRKDLKAVQTSQNWSHIVSLVYTEADLPLQKKEALYRQIRGLPFVSFIEDRSEILSYFQKSAPSLDSEALSEIYDQQENSKLYKQGLQQRAFIYLNNPSEEQVAELKSFIGSCCKLIGSLLTYQEISQMIHQTLFESLLLSLVLVVLILTFLAWAYGQSQSIGALLVSSLWGPCLLLAFVFVIQIEITVLSSIFFSILVGLTGDNAIQYIYASRKKSLHQGISMHGSASVFITALMSATSLTMLFAIAEPPKKLAILMFLGLWFALIGDLWILKGLTNKRRH